MVVYTFSRDFFEKFGTMALWWATHCTRAALASAEFTLLANSVIRWQPYKGDH